MAVSLSAGALAGASAIGSGISGLLGIGANALSAYQQYQYQKDLMKYQAQLNFNFGKKSAVNQYMWQRQGLEKANFNPQLAWQGAEGVANTGWTAPQSAPSPDYNSGIRNALDFYNAYQQASLMEKQGVQAISQANLNTENAEVAKSQVTLNNAESMLKMLQQEGQSIENRLKHVDLKWSDKEHLANLLKTNAETRGRLLDSTANIMNAYTNKYNANTMRTQMKNYSQYLVDQRVLSLAQAQKLQREFELMPIELKMRILDSTEKNIINIMSGGLVGGSMLQNAQTNKMNLDRMMHPTDAYMNTNIGF